MNTLLTKRKKYKKGPTVRIVNKYDDGGDTTDTDTIDFGKIMGAISSIGGGIMDIAKNTADLTQIKDISSIENNIDAQQNYTSYASSNDALMNEFANFQNLDNVTYGQVGKSGGEIASGIGSSIISGASAGGSVDEGWGALIGGVIGGISSGIGAGVGVRKAREKTAELNREIDIANAVAQKTLNDKVSSVDAMNDRALLMNYAANGGPLSKGIFSSPQYARYHQPQVLFADGGQLFNTHGGVFSNGVTHINSGNSHENNPLEGVQIGVDNNNIPNLVEEGEVIFGDYVFSDRLTVPKDVKKSMKLKNKKGLTFADAAKEVSKESEERPNDPISKNYLNIALDQLAEVQEDVRFKKQMQDPEFRQQAMAAMQQQALQEQAMMQQEQQMTNQQMQQQGIIQPQMSSEEQMLLEQQMGGIPFAFGGRVNKFSTGTEELKKYSYDPISEFEFWDATTNNYQSDYLDFIQRRLTQSFLDEILQGKHGSISRFLGAGNRSLTLDQFRRLATDKKYSDMHKAAAAIYKLGLSRERDDAETTRTPDREHRNRYWIRNKNSSPTPITDYFEGRNENGYTFEELHPDYIAAGSRESSEENIDYTDYYFDIKEQKDKENTKTKDNWLRYMPAIGSGLMTLASAFNRPDYSRAQAIEDSYTPVQGVSFTPIGDYMAYKPVDINYIANQLAAQSAATRNSIINNANGNRVTANAGLLAANYAAQTALGNAYIEANKENLARLQAAKEFNKATNQYNSTGFFNASKANADIAAANRTARMNAILTGAKMREEIDTAYSTALSNNMNNLFTNLGNIGQDNLYKEQADMVRPYLQYTQNIDAHGGKINRKKSKTKKGLTI